MWFADQIGLYPLCRLCHLQGPLHAQIGKLILVVSSPSPRCAAGSAPNPVITGEWERLIQVQNYLLTRFSTA
jgi:hypothetical protein